MTISDIPPFLLGCALGALTCLWCWLVERKLRKDEKEMRKDEPEKPAFDADEYRKELRQKIKQMEKTE